LATRNSVYYLITETVAALGILVFSYFLMPVLGLNGVGLAFSLNYLVYLALVYTMVRNRNEFSFDHRARYLIALSSIVVAVVFLLNYFYRNEIWSISASICIIGVISYSFFNQLNGLTGIFESIKKRLWKN
jgi:peptidoglycan biosynthesis protein MviN/MurJ (putative lipid II flippase)